MLKPAHIQYIAAMGLLVATLMAKGALRSAPVPD